MDDYIMPYADNTIPSFDYTDLINQVLANQDNLYLLIGELYKLSNTVAMGLLFIIFLFSGVGVSLILYHFIKLF